jgi:hypothetical protein
MVNACTLAQSLRAIGQALDKKKIRTCQVIRNGENFLVRVKNSTPLPHQHYQAGLTKQRRRLGKIHYTLVDVYRHQQQGRYKRESFDRTPDFYTLSQVMRTVGEYLDCKNARLDWLFLQGMQITIHYESVRGHKIVEQHTVATLYDFFVHMYLRRRRRMKLVA